MIDFMRMRQRVKISKGGQISIPAPIRHRWGTSTLVLEDEGDRLTLEPAADDPIEAATGAWEEYFRGADIQELRDQARREEAEIEGRKVREHRLA